MELVEVQKEADAATRKAMLFGTGALVMAGFLGWFTARSSGGASESQPVVVAAETVPPLTTLKAKHLKLVPWPLTSLPAGTFASTDDILKATQLNLSGLAQGEPILKSRLSTPERGLGVSNLVEPSMRAFVVQISDALAQSQIIHPNTFVDVVATIQNPLTREVDTKVILQNVQVLAVGDSVDLEPQVAEGQDKPSDRTLLERHRIVTLLVNVSDTEYLSFATSQGKIDLALRSNVDTEVVPTAGINSEKLLGGKGKDLPGAAPAGAANGAAHRPAAHAHSGSGPSIYRVPRQQ